MRKELKLRIIWFSLEITGARKGRKQWTGSFRGENPEITHRRLSAQMIIWRFPCVRNYSIGGSGFRRMCVCPVMMILQRAGSIIRRLLRLRFHLRKWEREPYGLLKKLYREKNLSLLQPLFLNCVFGKAAVAMNRKWRTIVGGGCIINWTQQ